jgi:1,4-alpha-glucan branching enzyme
MNKQALFPPGSPVRRLKPLATRKPVNFFCVAPRAAEVFLVGDFNAWQSPGLPMLRGPDGTWHLAVTLGHGGHHYQFIVDGQPVNDPRAQGLARNERGAKVSMILVS